MRSSPGLLVQVVGEKPSILFSAEKNSKSEVVTTEAPSLKKRRYTVGYIRDWKTHNKATSITLKGAWLDDAGNTRLFGPPRSGAAPGSAARAGDHADPAQGL